MPTPMNYASIATWHEAIDYHRYADMEHPCHMDCFWMLFAGA